MEKSVTLEMRDDVAVIWINNPPVNALSHHVRSGIVDQLTAAQNAGAKAAVIAGKGGTFIAGADIREFGKPLQEPGLPSVCNTIEATPIPVVAAIEGNTLGGGLEVALSCHHRTATPSARLGLPEVKLGLLPGAGGTQRLPRLLKNPAKTVQMVGSGNPISGSAAADIGLVDEVADDAIEAAVVLAKGLNGQVDDDRRLSTVVLELTDAINAEFDAAIADVAKKAKGAIAPVRAAETVRAAYSIPFDEGLALERSTFMELVVSDQSKALRHIFFAERQAPKPPKDVSGTPRDVKKVGIIGSGTMGGGIAMTYAEAGLPVTILEMSDAALDRGFGVIEKNWTRGIKSGRITEAGVAERMSRLSRTLNYDDLADCDLIIEAAFETMDVKRDVFRKLDAVAKPGAILASNTSYLNVDEIAAETNRPEDVLGMHYFSPANIMPLLEIVRAEKTADDVLLTALAVGKKTRKTAVVSGVGHGFIGNRMLTPYLRQANLLVLEGASPAQVDKALTDFGWAMGPFAVSDLAGLDIGYKSRQDQELDEHEARIYGIADKLVEAGFLGQKSGAGFYAYDPETRARSENPDATRIMAEVRSELGINSRDISDEEIVQRTQFALANEGAHVLGEGVAARAGDIDVVYNYGYGYPRWRGGPMHYLDTVGVKAAAAKIAEWTDGAGGVHWNPSDLLMSLAESDSSFAEWDRENAK